MRPVCVRCNAPMRCAKNGVPWPEPGSLVVWWGDVYACQAGCGAIIQTGWGPSYERRETFLRDSPEEIRARDLEGLLDDDIVGAPC